MSDERPPVAEAPEEPTDEEKSVGELVLDVTEKTSILVREEIELAKTEISEKLTKLLRGSVAGLVAGAFAFLALILIMHGIAWLLNDLFFGSNIWPGFLIEAVVFLLIAAAGGIYAWRAFSRGVPPTPEMAIEEAREIRSAFDGGDGQDAAGAVEKDRGAAAP